MNEESVRAAGWAGPGGWFYERFCEPDPSLSAYVPGRVEAARTEWDRAYATTTVHPRGWGKSVAPTWSDVSDDPPAWTRASVRRGWQATRDAVFASCAAELEVAVPGSSDDLALWVATELERAHSRLMRAYTDALIGDVENFRPTGIPDTPAVTEARTAEHWHVRTHLVPLVREAVRIAAVRVT